MGETVVGREIGVQLADVTADLTVEVVARDVVPKDLARSLEAHDKQLLRLRVDRRDASDAPAVVHLESAAGRQLAAALIAAADLAEDLVTPVHEIRCPGVGAS